MLWKQASWVENLKLYIPVPTYKLAMQFDFYSKVNLPEATKNEKRQVILKYDVLFSCLLRPETHSKLCRFR